MLKCIKKMIELLSNIALVPLLISLLQIQNIIPNKLLILEQIRATHLELLLNYTKFYYFLFSFSNPIKFKNIILTFLTCLKILYLRFFDTFSDLTLNR